MFYDIAHADFGEMASKLGSKLLVINGKKAGDDISLGGPGRADFERKGPLVLYGFENEPRKDGTHQRHSGLNEVLCKLAKEKGKILAFDFNALLTARDRSVVLGRMMQNARLIRKYKNDFIIASFAKKEYELRAKKDYIAFLEELGFDGKQGKKAVNLLGEIIKTFK